MTKKNGGRNWIVAALVVLWGSISLGATLYWDANGAGAGTGGSGNWNTTDSTWRNGGTGGTLQPWANNNDVNLPTTAGTITLTENIVVGVNDNSTMITLGASGYVINNIEGSTTSGESLTFNATGGSGNYRLGIDANGQSLTINAPVVLSG